MYRVSRAKQRSIVLVCVFLPVVGGLLGSSCQVDQGSGTAGGGNEPNVSGGVPPCPSAPQDGFLENFGDESSTAFRISGVAGRPVRFGQDSPDACDGRAAYLEYPAGNHGAGTENATAIETPETYHYGTYRARMRVPRGAPDETVVTGFFTFANTGQDKDGDGLFDNSEIDFEFVSGQPELVYLTVWTDAGDPLHPKDLGDFLPGPDPDHPQPNYQKVTRVINLRTGKIRQGEKFGEYRDVNETLARTIPDFDPAARFYEYQFEWRPDEVRFSIIDDKGELELWRLTDTSRIPKEPAQLIFDVWYSSNWNGTNVPNNPPSENADLVVDWASFSRIRLSPPTNLVVNGDFEQGVAGFESDYDLKTTPGGLSREGEYAVVADPRTFDTRYAPLVDHTSGTGMMLVADGHPSPGMAVWRTSVTVPSGRTLRFSMWIATADPTPETPAELTVYVNGEPVLVREPTPTPVGTWRQVSGLWNSGSATQATIEIVDEVTSRGSNDYAIDDIFFGVEP